MMSYTAMMRLGLDLVTLGAEAQNVIFLRGLKLAMGDKAAVTESQLMVQEKLDAIATLQRQAFTAWLGLTPQLTPRSTLTHLRRKVRANQRRLSR